VGELQRVRSAGPLQVDEGKDGEQRAYYEDPSGVREDLKLVAGEHVLGRERPSDC
jgi:hypothetical protein